MAEAVRAVIDYGIYTLGLEAFTCGHFVENNQSRRVIKKCGFRFVKYDVYYAKLLDKHFEDIKYIRLRNNINIDHLAFYYGNRNEEARFESKHGQIEFLTTMRYVER